MASKNANLTTGFTLIELLVVIAIIGVLSSVVLSNLNSARKSGNDAHRISEFRSMQTALEIYYESYGKYPCGDADWGGGSVDSSLSNNFLNGGIGDPTCPPGGLSSAGLFSNNARDPINSGGYFYGYDTNTSHNSYLLYARLERNSSKMLNDGGVCDNYYELGPALGSWTPRLIGVFGVSCD